MPLPEHRFYIVLEEHLTNGKVVGHVQAGREKVTDDDVDRPCELLNPMP
jgi:hypothetical protein